MDVIAQDEAGIDGVVNTAYSLTDTSGGKNINQVVAIPDDSNTHTLSMYLKKGSSTHVDQALTLKATLVNGSGTYGEISVDLVTGVPPKRLLWGLYGGGKTHTLFAVSKKIAKEHGGDLLIESIPSKGSKFTLVIPEVK